MVEHVLVIKQNCRQAFSPFQSLVEKGNFSISIAGTIG
jgi:hypothetical protein